MIGKKVRTYRDLENIRIDNPVVTIGIFDGVHTGHDSILDRIKSVAKEINGESTVVTFWPHPRIFLTPEGAGLKFLSTKLNLKILMSLQPLLRF